MRIQKFLILICLTFTFSNCKKSAQNNDNDTSETLFQLLPPEKTHVDFQNVIIEGLNTNVLMYEYFYNGGGVAVGDVNNDGLEDLYFTSNMEVNRLYLNRGNMTFEDVSALAGVKGREGPWKTGATMADVNGDGLMDIFVCYSGAVRPENRTKQLFINQGNDNNGIPQFADKAAEYGLDNVSTSTQASFFDYDRDGDLDMFLLNHNIKSLPVLNVLNTTETLKTEDPISGVRLFRHDKGKNGQPHFTDVTKQAHISSSPLSYGLGIGIADFNQDGWQDMYISNDYSVPDYLYINDKKGGFVNQINERLGHTSMYSMGNDVSDVNNDGTIDIFTLDMLPEDNHRQKLLMASDSYEKFNFNVQMGFGYQYMRNMLHLTDPSAHSGGAFESNFSSPSGGGGGYSEIGQLAGISNTDWSWAALFADYDNDGWKDLYITNGYLRDYTNLDFIKYMNDFTAEKQGLMNRERALELVNQMPSSNVTNYLFKNNGDLTFKNMVSSWGTNQTSNSHGAAYSDLDNDGDLDLVVNNINQNAFIYQNQSNAKNNYLKLKLDGEGMNRDGIGAKVAIYHQGKMQFQEKMPTHGYQSNVTNFLHFGIAKNTSIDSIKIVWLSGKTEKLKSVKVNQLLTVSEKNAKLVQSKIISSKSYFQEIQTLDFVHKKDTINDFKRQSLMTNPMSFQGPCITKGDVNGDGLEDIFVGGATNQAGVIYLQNQAGNFSQKQQTAFEIDKASYDTDALFFDANGDKFLDLYVCSGGYGNYQPNDKALQDRLYMNDGKGNFTKNISALLPMLTSTSCVRKGDVNGDGKMDLFVGGRVSIGSYPTPPTSYILINNGQGKFSNQTPEEIKQIGMVTDAAWVDLDGDKKQELIIVGEWIPITVFRIEKEKFENVTENYFDKNYTGLWNRLLVEDLNNDDKIDLVVGNLGLNSQLKASEKEPLDLYFKDFDENGSVEPILCSYIQGKSYPYLTRDELLEQLPIYRKIFTDYKTYADATIEDIFKNGELEKAGHLTVNCLKTMYFEGSNSGKFQEKSLPIEAQFSPVFTINTVDFDHDGKKDLVLAGNIHHSRLKFGNYDANSGFVFKNEGKSNFKYITSLGLKDDIRSALLINDKLFFGENQAKTRSFKILH
jgi:enediyne biosynthesis protein E4